MIRPVLRTVLVVMFALVAPACFSGDITGGGGGGGDDDGGGDPGDRPLEVDPPTVTIAPGGQRTFAASRSGQAVSAIAWSVEEGDAGGRITAGGEYAAPMTEGTYTVVATESGSGERATATVTVAQLVATTHGLSIPAAHPRLWFNPSRLARARAWFQANPFNPPTSEDSGGGYGDVALHGLLTDNATGSCTRAIEWGLSRLGDVDDSGGTACDSCRWTGEQLILVYDWCHPYFTAAQRATYVAGMSTGIQAWSRKSWGGPGMFQNNYYWGYLRNELEWSITAYEEDPAWAEAMLDWVFTNRLAQRFDPSTAPTGASRGGVASEGSEYGPVVGAYPLVPFVTASLLGRNVYEETPFWRESVYAVIYSTTPAPTRVPDVTGAGYTVFPFSDDEGWNSRFQAQTHYYPDFMTTMASYWPANNVGRHARQWTEMVGVTPWRHVQAVDEPTAPLAFDGLPLDFYAAGPRYFYGRSAWGASGTVVMLQLGDAAENTIGHQHGDYGTFQIWRGGRFLSHESAAYAGSSSTSVVGYGGAGSVDGALGIAHNTVLVNGANPGPQYSGPEAIVERLESGAGYAFAAVDLVPPATRMQEWRREFVFVRSLETLVILDRIQTADAAATRTFLNHCETAPLVSGDDSATCTVGDQALTMTTLLPAQRAYRVVDEGSRASSQHRIEVDTTPGTAQSYILTVLEARGASEPALTPSVTDGGSSYTVTLDGSTSITFQKGMTSTGGAIRIGGTERPLRAGVQAMSVTGDGPVWEP
ncbi:MAG: heparinase II/III family protein [Deltaproteobacteria bacterium]|nr:heparinase II/III family protein [Kofleriaceae bacterium]